eukprot:10569112-Ditylum_brightwellii.AAC.1
MKAASPGRSEVPTQKSSSFTHDIFTEKYLDNKASSDGIIISFCDSAQNLIMPPTGRDITLY